MVNSNLKLKNIVDKNSKLSKNPKLKSATQNLKHILVKEKLSSKGSMTYNGNLDLTLRDITLYLDDNSQKYKENLTTDLKELDFNVTIQYVDFSKPIINLYERKFCTTGLDSTSKDRTQILNYGNRIRNDGAIPIDRICRDVYNNKGFHNVIILGNHDIISPYSANNNFSIDYDAFTQQRFRFVKNNDKATIIVNAFNTQNYRTVLNNLLKGFSKIL